ncbi:hypothetical protein EJB05_28780, partial [Eragrostis curvula]
MHRMGARRRQGTGGSATRPRRCRRRTTLTCGAVSARAPPEPVGKFEISNTPRCLAFRKREPTHFTAAASSSSDLRSDSSGSGLRHAPMAAPVAHAAGTSMETDSSAPPKVRTPTPPSIRAEHKESLIRYYITKEYERIGQDNTIEKVKDVQMRKLKGYLALCMFGLGSIHWGGGEKVIEHLGKDFADQCIRFLTVLYFLGLVGATAGTLPDNALWPLFFAGLGAWLSFIFALALFHLETRRHYINPEHARYSFCIYSVMFSLYWSHAAQDPLPLHTLGKILLSIARGIFFILRFLYHEYGFGLQKEMHGAGFGIFAAAEIIVILFLTVIAIRSLEESKFIVVIKEKK